jgi:hypothetical protein
VVAGSILFTPNAVIFDPDPSDPLGKRVFHPQKQKKSQRILVLELNSFHIREVQETKGLEAIQMCVESVY